MIQCFNWVTGKARLKLNLYHVRVCDLNYTACVYVCVCARCLHQQHREGTRGGTDMSVYLASFTFSNTLPKIDEISQPTQKASQRKQNQHKRIHSKSKFKTKRTRPIHSCFQRCKLSEMDCYKKKVEWQLVIYDHIIRFFFTKSNIKFDSR